MRVELTFKGNTPTMNHGEGNGLIRMHWREKGKLLLRYQLEAMTQCRHRFTGPVSLELIRYKSAGPTNDHDNLVSSLKLLADAIKKAGIIGDDNNKHIVKHTYREEKCKRGEQRTVIILEDYDSTGNDSTQEG